MRKGDKKDMEECLLCHKWGYLENHHVFGGANRKLSEKYELKIKICHDCHNEPGGVHFNKEKRIILQQEYQEKAMAENNWTIEDFIKIFGKNYL